MGSATPMPDECIRPNPSARIVAKRGWRRLLLCRHFGTLDLTAPLHEEGQRRRRDPYRRNGAVRARCLAWLLHRRTDSHIWRGDRRR